MINSIDHYVVENINSASSFLKRAGIKTKIQDLKFEILNADTKEPEVSEYLSPIEAGFNVGLVSEAGVPCVADPGSKLVRLAHQKHIQVVPLAGPSSIILALMASGLNGQNFAFNGYLPIDQKQLVSKLKDLEKVVLADDQTQIFIEAPHRNDKLLSCIIQSCKDSLRLCLAVNLTSHEEYIRTDKIAEWKTNKPVIGKTPAIFLIGK